MTREEWNNGKGREDRRRQRSLEDVDKFSSEDVNQLSERDGRVSDGGP